MIEFINSIVNGDIRALIGEDLFAPTVAAIVASWSIIAFGAAASVFSHVLEFILNFRGSKK